MKSTGQGIRNVSFSEHFAYARANFFGNVASDFLRFSINDEILNGKLHFLCSAIQHYVFHYFMISLFAPATCLLPLTKLLLKCSNNFQQRHPVLVNPLVPGVH